MSVPSNRQQTSQIAKTYRQAAQLFLTRRLPEALSTIEPIIIPQSPQFNTSTTSDGPQTATAPIANASRGSRIKVWAFYLTFLNSVVELGPEEGNHAFGSTRWRALVAKARDGSVWEDIVRDGYHGDEGAVDAEVVVNLATLLLTHSPDVALLQRRLETYLSATSHPTLDLPQDLSASAHPLMRRPSHQSASGAATPRDLNTRLKLLELYTLHVLPRTEEWDYARDFIMMSEVLDDERKDAFLHALHSLREEKEGAEAREAQLRKQQEEQLEQTRREAEARRAEIERQDQERDTRREEDTRRKRVNGDARTQNGRPSTSSSGRPQPSSSRPGKATKKAISSPTFYTRASALIGAMQGLVSATATSLQKNPMAALRMLLFLLAFLLAFARKEVRERIKRMAGDSWNKVRSTVGMGVKVSYI